MVVEKAASVVVVVVVVEDCGSWASTPPPRILCSSMTAAGMSVKLHHSTSDELGGEGRKGMMLCRELMSVKLYNGMKNGGRCEGSVSIWLDGGKHV